MNYIAKINRFVKQDVIYGIKSKIFIAFTAVLLTLFCVSLFLGYSAVKESYEFYRYYVSYYAENDEQDQNEDSEYEVHLDENIEFINNPLAYYKAMTTKYSYAMSYKYLFSMLMESSLIYFPFVFSMFGIIWASYDTKYKTNRLKILMQGKTAANNCKQLSMITGIIIIFLFASVIAYLIGIILSVNLSSALPKDTFNNTFVSNSSILLQILFTLTVAIIFSEIGYTLAVCIKNTIVCVGIIMLYLIVFSDFGKYNIINIIKSFSLKIFDFLGIVSIENSESVLILPAILILLATFVVCLILNNIFSKIKSAY